MFIASFNLLPIHIGYSTWKFGLSIDVTAFFFDGLLWHVYFENSNHFYGYCYWMMTIFSVILFSQLAKIVNRKNKFVRYEFRCEKYI